MRSLGKTTDAYIATNTMKLVRIQKSVLHKTCIVPNLIVLAGPIIFEKEY